jgi:hypothetical protein
VNTQVSGFVAGPEKRTFAGIFPRERRFAFLYAVIAAAAVAFVMTISGVAGLVWWQSVLMLIGTVIVGWAVLFSVLEIRRLGKGKDEVEEAEDVDAYPSRKVVVAPPTCDACVHHEDYVESQGFDQGQLTSRIPDGTPFIDEMLRGREKQEAVAK